MSPRQPVPILSLKASGHEHPEDMKCDDGRCRWCLTCGERDYWRTECIKADAQLLALREAIRLQAGPPSRDVRLLLESTEERARLFVYRIRVSEREEVIHRCAAALTTTAVAAIRSMDAPTPGGISC